MCITHLVPSWENNSYPPRSKDDSQAPGVCARVDTSFVRATLVSPASTIFATSSFAPGSGRPQVRDQSDSACYTLHKTLYNGPR